MSRSESSQAAKDAAAKSKLDQANAQLALGTTNADLLKFQQQIERGRDLGRSIYRPGGSYMQAENAINTSAAGAAANKVQGDMATHAMQTGENTAGYAPALAEEERAGQRDVAAQMAQAEKDRMQAEVANEYQAGSAYGLPAQVQAGLYGTSISGATGQADAQVRAASMPSGWDIFGPALIGAAGGVAKGFTPHG